MKNNRTILKALGIAYLVIGTLILLYSSRRFIHHFDFRVIGYTQLLPAIIFIVTGIKRLRRLKTLPS